jgi:hypothetical protein
MFVLEYIYRIAPPTTTLLSSRRCDATVRPQGVTMIYDERKSACVQGSAWKQKHTHQNKHMSRCGLLASPRRVLTPNTNGKVDHVERPVHN